MRWKLKGNWNGAGDKSLHTHSFSFGLNHFWPLKWLLMRKSEKKDLILKSPLFPINLLTFFIVVHFRIDWLKRTFWFFFFLSIRRVMSIWGWNSFNNFLKGLYLTLWYISFLLSGTICVFDPHLLFRTLTNFINLLSDKRKFSPSHEKFLVQIYHYLQMVL